MKCSFRSIALMVFATSIFGCRELKEPKNGYIIVPNVFSPVRVHTSDLEGAGWMKAHMPGTKQWTPFFLEPEGAFIYNEPLPGTVWRCKDPGGHEGCIAMLQVGDEKGTFPTGNEDSVLYVCTENYIQRVGHKHCGDREFRATGTNGGPFDENDRMPFPPRASMSFSEDAFLSPSRPYEWHGDPNSRFFRGHSSFPNAESPDPPSVDTIPPSGVWNEYPYDPERPEGYAGYYPSAEHARHVDLGARWIFLPYEWENRLEDLFTDRIGEFTEDRGIAEMMIDKILETPPNPTFRIEEDVFAWADGSSLIKQRTDVSPEFHFRMAEDTLTAAPDMVPEICFKNYMRAGTSLWSGADDWYRWDQGLVSAFASLFNIGDCRDTSASIMYCGQVKMKNGEPVFIMAPDVRSGVRDDYSWFKPACRNSFVPKLRQGLIDGAKTAGAENMTDGLKLLVDGLQNYVSDAFLIDFKVRRLELTPTGIYVVTASNTLDPQYALPIGNSTGDLTDPNYNAVAQPQVSKVYYNRGITRPVP